MTGTMLAVLGLVAVVAFAIGFIVGAALTIKLAFVAAAQSKRMEAAQLDAEA